MGKARGCADGGGTEWMVNVFRSTMEKNSTVMQRSRVVVVSNTPLHTSKDFVPNTKK